MTRSTLSNVLLLCSWIGAAMAGACSHESSATPGTDGGTADAGPQQDGGGQPDGGAPLTCPASHVKVVTPTFPARSVIVAAADVVADFGADPTGGSDATAQFQSALGAVALTGGGTVWVPAGTYRFDGPLTMPQGVTLRGDWKQPTGSDKTVGGTVLAIYYSDGPFLTVTSDAALEGLNFWYPEQSLASPILAPAVAFVQDGHKSVESITILDSTFVNPGVAIDTVTYGSDTGGNHLIANVYGAALATGVLLRPTSSTSRNEDNHLAARYWSDSGLPGAPDYADLAAYMQANATGFVYEDNWGSINLTVDDFGTGILFDGRNVDNQVTGQQTVGLEIRGAHRAVDIEQGNNFYVNNGLLGATVGSDAAAVYVGSGAGKSSLLLDEVEVASAGDGIDDESPQFTVNVSHSTFDAWHGYAIAAAGADVIVAGSTFSQLAGTNGDKDLSLGDKITHAIIMSNTFADGFTLDSKAANKKVWVDDDPLVLAGGISGFASSGQPTQLVLPPAPLPARTGAGSLYDASCYGAVADCAAAAFDGSGRMVGSCTDNTGPLQAALDAAGAAGGGTVFVPPSATGSGYYVAGHLSVPSGVELAGPEADHLFRPSDTHTMLIVEGDGDPLVTLAANAGVRGLAFWYANQNGYAPQPFGYTVQARGAGDWIINVVLPNTTNGVDFGTYGSDRHYIYNFSSQGYANALYISKSTGGYVGDFQHGGGGGNRGGVVDYPSTIYNPPGDLFAEGGGSGSDGLVDTDVGQVADCYKSGVGILLGGAKQEEIVNAYVHGPHVGLQAIADGADGGPSFTLVHFGSETFTGLDVEALDPAGAKVIQSEYHTISTDGYPQNAGKDIVGSPYLVVGSDVDPAAPLTIFTLANHAYTPIGFELGGGKTIVQQYFSDQDANEAGDVTAAFDVTGAATGFAVIGGRFINPLDPGVAIRNASSPNVAFAGMSLASALATSGPVDLSFQPPW